MGPISIWVLDTAKEKRSNGMKTCSRVRKNEDKCKQYRCLRPEVAWISATLVAEGCRASPRDNEPVNASILPTKPESLIARARKPDSNMQPEKLSF